jgi:3-keto-disaccharide hydrolase
MGRATRRTTVRLPPQRLSTAVLALVVLASGGCSSGGGGNAASGGSARTGGSSGGGAGSAGAGALATGGGAATPGAGGSGPSGTAASGGEGAGTGGVASGGSSGSGPAVGGSGGGEAVTGGTAGASTAGGAGGGPPTVDLFDGTDLTGFNVYMATSSSDNNSPGTLLTGAAAEAIFKPENGTIHVYGDLPDKSAQVHYLLQTVSAYGKYNLSWDYKWGTKKFAPYEDATTYPRDAGVLWHIHGDKTRVWPSSIEFQNKWGTTGDIFALYAQCKSLGLPNDLAQFAEAAAGGVEMTVNGSNGLVQHMRSADWETPGVGPGAATGEGSDWNSCLLQVDGGTAVYTVNGHVVNRVLEVMDKNGNPITSGFIAWQAEQAEVYYRNLRIQVLP